MTSGTSTAGFEARPARPLSSTPGAAALHGAAAFWLAVTVAGQMVFAVYIALLYGGAALRGNFQGWNAVMTHGHVPGETAGNVATGVHLLLAALIMLGGALQLVPHIRTHAPRFHRWNGRVYLCGALVAALTGLYMLWFRGTVGDVVQHLGTTLNAVLIVAFAVLALRAVLRRDVPAHRRWALRLFLAVSGVWFFRVGLMFWLAVNGGPAGFDPATFTGPALSVLAFGQYLLPLAVLEVYLRVRAHGGAAAQWGMAAGLSMLTLAMALGVGVATMGMWLPRM